MQHDPQLQATGVRQRQHTPQRTQPSSLSRGTTRVEGSLNRGELFLPVFIRQRHRIRSGIGMATEGEVRQPKILAN